MTIPRSVVQLVLECTEDSGGEVLERFMKSLRKGDPIYMPIVDFERHGDKEVPIVVGDCEFEFQSIEIVEGESEW